MFSDWLMADLNHPMRCKIELKLSLPFSADNKILSLGGGGGVGGKCFLYVGFRTSRQTLLL
jgi:hypothetical protein